VWQVRHSDPTLDADFVSMVAWVRPMDYDTVGPGIIINKEASYQMGVQVGSCRVSPQPTRDQVRPGVKVLDGAAKQ
jgi:hypothetical protein